MGKRGVSHEEYARSETYPKEIAPSSLQSRYQIDTYLCGIICAVTAFAVIGIIAARIFGS